jgi:hypothetical protein
MPSQQSSELNLLTLKVAAFESRITVLEAQVVLLQARDVALLKTDSELITAGVHDGL